MYHILGVSGFGVLALAYIGIFSPASKTQTPFTEMEWVDQQTLSIGITENLNLSNFDAFKGGVVSIESGGNYNAVSPVNKDGTQAYGKFQVLGPNVPKWTEEVVGRRMSAKEFMTDHDAQEKVFEVKIGQCYAQYHNWADCASWWFSGSPLKGNHGSDVTGMNVPRYVKTVLNYMATHGATPSVPQNDASRNVPRKADANGLVRMSNKQLASLPSKMQTEIGLLSANALQMHCKKYHCPVGGINNPGAQYPSTLSNGQKAFFVAEIHENCSDGRPTGCPHTGISTFTL